MIPKEAAKQERDDPCAPATRTTTTTTTATWSRLKDPRIVRVSRAMGGKDRHSKVCTVRGLRDRRVRLSVPTAIQLYDLQERLGLSQPSKVVDWLLDAARNEIDELPPLQIPQGLAFSQMLLSPAALNSKQHEKNVFFNQEQREPHELINLHQNPPSFPSLIGHEGFQHQHQHQHQHLLVYQSPGMLAQPYFLPQVNTDHHYTKQPGFHSLDLSSSSSSLSARPPFDFNINSDLLPSQSKQA